MERGFHLIPWGAGDTKSDPSLQAIGRLCLWSGAKAGGKTKLRCGRAPHEGESRLMTWVQHRLKSWENTGVRCHRAGEEC